MPLRRALVVPLAAALAGVALVAAGCGGSTPNGSAVANIGTTDTTATTTGSSTPLTGQGKQQVAFAFSKCMRANGVPSFPDPQTSGGGLTLKIGPGSGLDPNSPSFKRAQTKCQKLLPNGGRPSQAEIQKAEQQALAFAKCMRAHGVPNFPDPQFDTSGGGFGIRLGGPGLDRNAPALQKAQQACGKLLPGRNGPPGGSTASGNGGKP